MPVYTVKFPLDVVSKRDTFDVIDENNIEEVVKFNIKSTILTCPGERRGNPTFGACAKQYLFELATPGRIETMRSNMYLQISEHVPYANVTDIIISNPDNSPNALFISIVYTIPAINKKDVFELLLTA